MGDRAQVLMEESGIYLYTHWGAKKLVEDVRKALKKRWRWNDHEYLARIIFDEMIGNDRGSETGYGIGKSKHEDIWRLVTITKDNRVKVSNHGRIIYKGSFDKFIEQSLTKKGEKL